MAERRVILATATYRSFEFHYGLGVTTLGWASDEVKSRLAALDASITPGLARGYGAGRNLGQLFVGAIDERATHVLTVDSDIAWTADHVVRILEAERWLSSSIGPVIVGAVYPQSRLPDSQILCELRDGVRLPMHDGNPDPELAERFLWAVEKLADTPGDMKRYAEAWLLPGGFTLWPTEPFRTCAAFVGEEISASRNRYWDNAMCDVAMSQGVRLFADLALDVGHMSLEPVTSVGRLAELARRRSDG